MGCCCLVLLYISFLDSLPYIQLGFTTWPSGLMSIAYIYLNLFRSREEISPAATHRTKQHNDDQPPSAIMRWSRGMTPIGIQLGRWTTTTHSFPALPGSDNAGKDGRLISAPAIHLLTRPFVQKFLGHLNSKEEGVSYMDSHQSIFSIYK